MGRSREFRGEDVTILTVWEVTKADGKKTEISASDLQIRDDIALFYIENKSETMLLLAAFRGWTMLENLRTEEVET